MPKRKLLCRPWAVLTDGKLTKELRIPLFTTRQAARCYIAISPYRAAHCKPVRVEVYVAKG